MTLKITPEPSPEELVAITAAITAAVHFRSAADLVSAPVQLRPSRWARQGRHESMRGLRRQDAGENGT